MDSKTAIKSEDIKESVSRVELNSWRRGFTPQAEIWNGRMAMGGLIVCLASLFVSNLIFGTKLN